MDKNYKLKKLLSKNGYSLTTARIELFKTISNITKPLPVSRLADMIGKADRASVYRNIAIFEKIGIINRVWNGFKSTVELSDEFSEHHHHMTCTVCARSVKFDNTNIETILKSIAFSHGFESKSHIVEITGYCSNCIPKAN